MHNAHVKYSSGIPIMLYIGSVVVIVHSMFDAILHKKYANFTTQLYWVIH